MWTAIVGAHPIAWLSELTSCWVDGSSATSRPATPTDGAVSQPAGRFSPRCAYLLTTARVFAGIDRQATCLFSARLLAKLLEVSPTEIHGYLAEGLCQNRRVDCLEVAIYKLVWANAIHRGCRCHADASLIHRRGLAFCPMLAALLKQHESAKVFLLAVPPPSDYILQCSSKSYRRALP